MVSAFLNRIKEKMDPKVTFIVPCYKLAHYLAKCVDSILSQTYKDFEILIMDDCSPDNTPEVAQSFGDFRVRHIRNERNLGNIANYNRGIGLARGQYVWLISADDQLRCSYVLDRYVQVMDLHPRVGYVFCPNVELREGMETSVMTSTLLGNKDTLYKGHDFFDMLIRRNVTDAEHGESRWFSVEAPAVMVRKECYDKLTLFPPELSHAGDRYIWCLFALYYDVAYMAEPMVSYRIHDSSMSYELLKNDKGRKIFSDEITVCWQLRERAEAMGALSAVRSCNKAIVGEYLRWLYRMEENCITIECFEESLHSYARDSREESRFLALVYARLGDHYFWRRDLMDARRFYKKAVKQDFWTLRPQILKCILKCVLISMGSVGTVLIESFSTIRQQILRLKRCGRQS